MANHCESCCNCCNSSKKTTSDAIKFGYVKFAGDTDQGIWLHGIIYDRATELNHFSRDVAMKQIRKEFGISL